MALENLPGTNYYALPQVVQAWESAGSPTVNDAYRSYAQQESSYQTMLSGGPAADNPDGSGPRVHMRGAAIDVNANAQQTAALKNAGLVQPYADEPWHFQLPDWASFPILKDLSGSVMSAADSSRANTNISQPAPGNKYVWGDKELTLKLPKPFGDVGTGIHTRFLLDIAIGITSIVLFGAGILFLITPDFTSIAKKVASGDVIPIPV